VLFPPARLARVATFIAPALVAVACGGSTEPKIGPPAAITAVTAPANAAIVGTTLTPLTVKVADANGNAIAAVSVTFSVTAGFGSVAPSTVVTDATGQATTVFTLGTVSGPNEVTASVTGLAAKYKFSATGTPGPLARVVVSPRSVKMYTVGDTLRLTASTEDQFGNPAPTPTTWTARDNTLVSVDATGLVRSLRKGASTYVIATASGKTDSILVEVPTSPCQGGPSPVVLAVGQVTTASLLTSTCITGATGAEFAVVAFNTSTTSSGTSGFEVVGNGLGAAPVGSLAPSAQLVPTTANFYVGGGPALERDDAFETAFMAREQRELAPLVPGARAWYNQRQAGVGARRNVVPATVNVGDIFPMNVNGLSSCSPGTTRGVRVTAVSRWAVIVSDTANPAGASAFTDADFASIAAAFDTLVTPVDTAAFGSPTDIDNNGKVVIIYTKVINDLTPPGSSSFVGGLTASRDLFPTTGNASFQGCAGSNAGEMFYMLVPDSGAVGGHSSFSRSFVKSITVGTVAHEYQHLINAARRLYIYQMGGTSWNEEIWLNEGLAHMAEELTYYRSSRNSPRTNLSSSTIRASQAQVDAYNSFHSGNFSRYQSFLQSYSNVSPFAQNDDLSTRGATWSFLRYAADRIGSTDGDLWYVLANGASRTTPNTATHLTGMANLQAALGVDAAGLVAMTRDWTVSLYFDDFVTGLDPKYTQPSWNWRGLYQGLFSSPRAFPIVAGSLADGSARPTTLVGAASVVYRFSVATGVDALIRATGAGGAALTAPVTLAIVRTK
jgi:hypothetical protein